MGCAIGTAGTTRPSARDGYEVLWDKSAAFLCGIERIIRHNKVRYRSEDAQQSCRPYYTHTHTHSSHAASSIKLPAKLPCPPPIPRLRGTPTTNINFPTSSLLPRVQSAEIS
jgi:hypothetical protein